MLLALVLTGCAATRQLSSRLTGNQSAANLAVEDPQPMGSAQPEGSEDRFQRALQICRASLEKGYLDGSLLWADQAIGLKPTAAEAWAVRARVHDRMGKHEQALNDLLQAQRLDPNSSEIALAVAQHYEAQGDHRRCLTAINQIDCTTASPELVANAHRLAGASYLQLDRPHDAADRCRMAIEGGTACPTVASMLAEAEALCGRGAEHATTPNVRVADQSTSGASSVYR